jgi:hypothetical protein
MRYLITTKEVKSPFLTKWFDAVNADDLHLKIYKYMKERTTDTVNRWYYMKMVDIERL